ncbi:hypothetical protein ACHAXT_012942 [Thalassiosira profunda]
MPNADHPSPPRRQGSSLPPPPSSAAKAEGDARYAQLAAEKEHKELADDQRRELLRQKLERLRALKDELAADDWMFEGRR